MNGDGKMPARLYEESFFLSGARRVLQTLHDQGMLQLEKEKDHKPYTEAGYRLLMSDREVLLEWLGGGGSYRYKDHQSDKKGKLIKVTAYKP